MKTLHVVAVAVALTALTAVTAAAHPGAPRVDHRQAAQHLRIHDGVRQGELSARERRRLRAGQRHVRRVERRAGADGVLTPRERAHLERLQDRQSRRIARLRHNGRA